MSEFKKRITKEVESWYKLEMHYLGHESKRILEIVEEAKAEFPNGRRFETPMDHANAIIDWFNHWFGEK